MNKITDIAHMILKESNTSNIGIDFTCGNGFDTKFLCELCQSVYAFDIQEIAIKNTKEACKEFTNLQLCHTSHLNFDDYVTNFDVGIFNLGYLPQGDKTIYTDKDIVLKTIDKALNYLNPLGRLLIVCYPGFDAGLEESKLIDKYCEKLNSKSYDVAKFKLLNRNSAPYIIIIDKHKKG